MDATDISFTQAGTGAVTTTLDALLHQKIYTPEMFTSNVISAPLLTPAGPTPAGSVPNATMAMQKCIDALAAIGGGTMQLGPGVYGVTTLNITANNIFICGSGRNATTLMHSVTAPSSCLFFSATGILSNVGVSDLTIGSAETAITKVAIDMNNVSCPTIKNVDVGRYPWDGYLYTASGGVGVGLSIKGLDLGLVDNFFCYADQPIVIATSIDSWVFKDFVGYAGTSTTNSVITIASGTALTNVTFCGHQNWIGGLDGLHWVDTTSVSVAEGLYLLGIKSEQAGNQAGYTVNIQHHIALYGLHIGDGIAGDRNGIFLRKVPVASVTNFYYDANSNPNKIGLNLDSTDAFVQLAACTWVLGTLLTMSGLTLQSSSGIVSGYATTIPSSGIYTVTGSKSPTLAGTTTGDNAAAGNVGEYIESVVLAASAIPYTSNALTPISAGITLPAGDWDVDGILYFQPATTTSFTRYAASLSQSTSFDATAGRFVDHNINATVSGGNTFNATIPNCRFNTNSPITVSLVALGTFTVSTAKIYGVVRARRVR
jgi:hypothetical protein